MCVTQSSSHTLSPLCDPSPPWQRALRRLYPVSGPAESSHSPRCAVVEKREGERERLILWLFFALTPLKGRGRGKGGGQRGKEEWGGEVLARQGGAERHTGGFR